LLAAENDAVAACSILAQGDTCPWKQPGVVDHEVASIENRLGVFD